MTTPRITIGRLMADFGTGSRQTRRLVREGKLPGFVDKYGAYFCAPGEYQKWLDGDWTYTGVRSEPPVSSKPKQAPLVVRNLRDVA